MKVIEQLETGELISTLSPITNNCTITSDDLPDRTGSSNETDGVPPSDRILPSITSSITSIISSLDDILTSLDENDLDGLALMREIYNHYSSLDESESCRRD